MESNVGRYARVLKNHDMGSTRWNDKIGKVVSSSDSVSLRQNEYALIIQGEKWPIWFIEEHLEFLPDEEGAVLWITAILER